MHSVIFAIIMMMTQSESFKEVQLKKTRVKDAYSEKEAIIRNAFMEKNLNFDGFQLFLRAFKKERKLEVWIREREKIKYTLLTTYDFCAFSGSLGPKRKEGDLQIPEGVYHINHFNPESNFHLSLGISYPNESDRLLSDKSRPGGAIYVHGNCVTIGCIPITDDKIKELYVIAVEARNNGQKKIPIHIFPSRLDDASMKALIEEFGAINTGFWKSLQPVFLDFERTRTLKKVAVGAGGEYVMN